MDNKIQNYEQAFGAKDITTRKMKDAIAEWYGLYYAREPTEKEDPCQRIPFTVVNKLTKTVFSEYSAATAGKTQDAFLQSVLDGLDSRKKQAMQHALIGGECLLKPLFIGGSVQFSVIQRRSCLVLGRNELDEITDVGTMERAEDGGYYYTLLERRSVDGSGLLTIAYRLFRSSDKSVLGLEVPLSALDKYAVLAPSWTYSVPVFSTGLIPVRCPAENCVDGSEDAVSVYAPAAGLIHLINVNEAQINGEFERGESRIITSSDMMKAGPDGKRRFEDHVFTGLDDDIENVGVTIFSPAFREQSFLARKTEYLRDVENIIGLKRGILSEVEAAERTATEITSSAGDYNLTIIDFQTMWERAVREAARVCGILGPLYKVGGAEVDPEKDIKISWGNGILYDEDKTWTQYQGMVAAGMLKPEIAVAWYFDIPWKDDKDLEQVREKYMPAIEQMTAGSGGD
jgi:A118 family predicted phage portal protein